MPNRSLPHTLKDYRIAAALVNCFHKRLFSDKEDFQIIVSNIKKNLSKENDLQINILSSKRHHKSQYNLLESSKIDDFPQIDLDQIKMFITLGSYQLKQAFCYIAEHINNGKYLIMVNKDESLFHEYKVLLAEIQSRHINSIQYRTYVKYKPYENEVKSICGWYCTCKNGTRTTGCCSHVASLILFFSTVSSRKNSNFTFKHLAHNLPSIFPYKESSDEIEIPANSSINNIKKTLTKSRTCVKSHTKTLKYESNSDEHDDNKFDTELELENNEIAEFLKNSSSRKTNDTKYEIFPDTSTVEIDKINESLKRLSSPILEEDRKRLKKNISEEEFLSRLPKWGGISEDNQTSFTNTCTIDYFLLAFWTGFKLSSYDLSKNEMYFKIKNIIDSIEENNWNRAKSIWVFEIMKCRKTKYVSTYGSEYEKFITYYKNLQLYSLNLECSLCCNYNLKSRKMMDIIFQKDIENNNILYHERPEVFTSCNKNFIKSIVFNDVPFFLFIQCYNNVYLLDLPKIVKIGCIDFKLLCASFYNKKEKHFKSFFEINDIIYLIDDLKKFEKIVYSTEEISTALYYLI